VLRFGSGVGRALLLVDRDLARRATAEAIGTAFLVAIVVGSGIYAQRLSPDDIGLQLLENSIATGAGLIALILAFGPVSGAHFNPVVTLADRLLGGISNRAASVYVIAQVVGGCIGAIVANLMFSLDAVNLSTHTRSSGGLWLGEFVATIGLLLVIFGVVRSGRSSVAPFAVGGYIAAAYWFTSSTSFANPAVTIARTLSNTFAGIRPSSAPAFIVVQIVAALCAVALVRFLHPNVSARDIVVPHEAPDDSSTAAGLPAVLFLCVHNAGRSQMALGWFRHFAAGRAIAWSGGSEPGAQINPSAVAVMAEVGIDITGEFPKPWTDEIVRAADVVVTMGCGDACPFYPGKRYEDWELDDPAGQGIEAVRPIRDEIRDRVIELLQSLSVAVG
jgi:arsenate reductase